MICTIIVFLFLQRLKEIEKKFMGSADFEGSHQGPSTLGHGSGSSSTPAWQQGFGSIVSQEAINSRIDQLLHDRLQSWKIQNLCWIASALHPMSNRTMLSKNQL